VLGFGSKQELFVKLSKLTDKGARSGTSESPAKTAYNEADSQLGQSPYAPLRPPQHSYAVNSYAPLGDINTNAGAPPAMR